MLSTRAARLRQRRLHSGAIQHTSLTAPHLRRNPPCMMRFLNIHHFIRLLFNRLVGSQVSLTSEKTSHRTPEGVLGVRALVQDGALRDARVTSSRWRHCRYRTLPRLVVRLLYVLGNLHAPERTQPRGDGRNKGPFNSNIPSRNRLTENIRSAMRIAPPFLPYNSTRRSNDDSLGCGPPFGAAKDFRSVDCQSPLLHQSSGERILCSVLVVM